MKEITTEIRPEEIFLSGYDSSEEPEENNFNSPEANPENIFGNQSKENSEQLSSKILSFPFTLDTYELINLKGEDDPELGGSDLQIILGHLEKLKNNELVLKLTFVSKDKKSSLNLKDHQQEINSLINLDLQFIGICQNKLFIQYDNELSTNEAYTSLQKSYDLFDLLYDEEKSFNCNEESSDKKSNKKTEEKKEENKSEDKIKDIELNNATQNILGSKTNITEENPNTNMNVKKNLFPQNIQNHKNIKEQPPKQNPINPLFFSPQLYNPLLFQFNNFPKIPKINPALMAQIPKPNPLLIQTALVFQNLMKIQQQSQLKKNFNIGINNDKKDLINNIKNINQANNSTKININSNMNKNNNLSPINNKESSTNSNTSSSSSNSSPLINYQTKNIKNFKIDPNNNNNNTTNSNNTNNNLKKKIDDNLEEIVQNKQYKEYIPKKIKEKELQFQTNSTRDYQYKYVSRYIVQIENEKNFPVTKMIIGNNGMLLRNILYENCIKFGDHTTKIRLRGKGSGYKEGPKKEESKDPMELCISSLNIVSFSRCSTAIEQLLLQIYYNYYEYQRKNIAEKNKDNNNKLINNQITMKKILKYHYIVNRYNTLVKEEKRRKKEEQLKKENNNNNEKYDSDN